MKWKLQHRSKYYSMFGTLILCNNDLNRGHVNKLKERKKIAPLE